MIYDKRKPVFKNLTPEEYLNEARSVMMSYAGIETPAPAFNEEEQEYLKMVCDTGMAGPDNIWLPFFKDNSKEASVTGTPAPPPN
jgi:hypothetical protein